MRNIGISIAIYTLSLFAGRILYDTDKYLPFPDFVWQYGPQAESFLNLEYPTCRFQGPMYPALLAIVAFPLGGDRRAIETSGKLVGSAASTAFIYWVIVLFGWQTALLTALTSTFVVTSSFLSTDMVYSAFLMCSLCASSATASVLAILTRPIAVFSVPYVVYSKGVTAKTAMYVAAAGIIFFVLSVNSDSIWNHYCMAQGNAGPVEAKFMQYSSGDVPGLSIKAWVSNYPLTLFTLATASMGILGVIGITGYFMSKKNTMLFLMTLIPASILHSAAFMRPRFSLIFIPFVAYGVLWLTRLNTSES